MQKPLPELYLSLLKRKGPKCKRASHRNLWMRGFISFFADDLVLHDYTDHDLIVLRVDLLT